MCGRTACTLAPDELAKRCVYATTFSKDGCRKSAKWVDNKHEGHIYKTSFNKAPGSVCPVLVAKKHLPKTSYTPTKEDDRSDEDSKKNNQDGDDTICLFPMLWGLVPPWHDGHPSKTGLSTSNCRSEGMLEKKMFSESLRRGFRCVIVVDGFYEWKTTTVETLKGAAPKKKATMTKQPYFIYTAATAEDQEEEEKQKPSSLNDYDQSSPTADDFPVAADCFIGGPSNDNNKSLPTDSSFSSPSTITPTTMTPSNNNIPSISTPTSVTPSRRLLTMAGLFSIRSPRGGEGCDPRHPLYSYSVITVPSSTMQWLHHRQPAVLTTDEQIRRWLSVGELSTRDVKELIRPVTSLGFYPVSTIVNNANNNDEKCMEPVDLKVDKEAKKPKPNALTMWLAKSKENGDVDEHASVEKVVDDDSIGIGEERKIKKREKATNTFMSSWLAKGKRKSDVDDNPEETNKRTKNM